MVKKCWEMVGLGLGLGEALNPVFQLQQGGTVSFRNGAFSTYSEEGEDKALLHLQNAVFGGREHGLLP